MQARQQAQTVASIRKKIKHHDLVLRLTDKGHNFYIGSAIEFEKKAQKFFADTNAFVELNANPFDDVMSKVIQLNLLNSLHSKKLIFKWQYEAMKLYFNPKTHKVSRILLTALEV